MKLLLPAFLAIFATSALAQNSSTPDELVIKYGTPDAKFMDRLKPFTPKESLVVCAGQALPQGWVITARTTNFNCPGGLNNAWVIKQPDVTEVICYFSPIPQGYLVTATTTNFNCSDQMNNAKVIRRI